MSEMKNESTSNNGSSSQESTDSQDSTAEPYHLLTFFWYRDMPQIILLWIIWHLNVKAGYCIKVNVLFLGESDLYELIMSKTEWYLLNQGDLCNEVWKALSEQSKSDFFTEMLSVEFRDKVIIKSINEILWLYLVMKEEAEGLLTLSESLESFKRFIDTVPVTEEYLKVIEGIEAWKALAYYQKGSVENNLTAWTVSQGILWKGQHLWLNISNSKADVKMYIFELLSTKEQEEFVTNLGLHWGQWFVTQRNPFMRSFFISKFREYTFLTTESILLRLKPYFSSVTELWEAFWKNEINELQLIHLDLNDEGKASQLMLFMKLKYETAIRKPDVVLGSVINSVRLFNESALILHSHHESIFIEWAHRYLIRGEINDDQLYSLLIFLMYAKNNLHLRHEYESYIEMNLKYNDHPFLPESEFDSELMPQGKSITREELDRLKVINPLYFIKLVYTKKDLNEELLKFLEDHPELKLRTWSSKTLRWATMKTPEMKEDMTMHEQIEQTEDESETFEAYTLATDFSNVEMLKLSSASETRTFTACKMTHST